MEIDLAAEKKRLRDTIIATRGAMSLDARLAASAIIIDRVSALPQYSRAKVVLAYMGFGSEIATAALFARILADGKVAVLPRVDRATQSLALHSALSVADLEMSKWGIAEPRADAPRISMREIEFVLIPGVAFDRNGNRLGYGRGYYDKLLVTADPALVRVAAAFACQIVARVPTDARDQKVATIITETEIIHPKNER